MLNFLKRRKRKAMFSIRPQLRQINKDIAKATYLVDVALVEELMEEKHRLFESIY